MKVEYINTIKRGLDQVDYLDKKQAIGDLINSIKKERYKVEYKVGAYITSQR